MSLFPSNPSGALAEHIPGAIPVYDVKQRHYINFGPSPYMDSNLEPSKREFWTQIRTAH